MKVYKRVRGGLAGVLFSVNNYGNNSLMLINGRWIESGWWNEDLINAKCFKLVGNNFKLKR